MEKPSYTNTSIDTKVSRMIEMKKAYYAWLRQCSKKELIKHIMDNKYEHWEEEE